MTTKTAKKPAKKTAKSKPSAAKKRPSGPNIPPADTPELPPATGNGKRPKKLEPDKTAELVEFLERRGYKINRHQYSRLTDAEQNNIRRWMEDVTHGKHHTVPPCLLEFDTNGNTRVGGAISPEDVPEKFFLPAKFGRVSYEDTGSVPIVISKNALAADQAEKLLCNTRLGVLIELRPNSERNSLLEEPTDPRIEFEMDSKGYRSSKDGWHITLKFGIDLDHLLDFGKFAGQEGRCELSRLGEIEGRAEHNGAHPDVEAGKDKPHGTPVLAAAAKALKESKQKPLIPEEDDLDELMVLPQTPNSRFIARVEPDGEKWRAGCDVRFVSGEFEETEDSFADEAATSQTTLEYAVTAVVERWIGYLQKREEGDWTKPIADLQNYLSRLRSGATPQQIDQEIVDAMLPAESEMSDADDDHAADAVRDGDAPFGLRMHAEDDQDEEDEETPEGDETEE